MYVGICLTRSRNMEQTRYCKLDWTRFRRTHHVVVFIPLRLELQGGDHWGVWFGTKFGYLWCSVDDF